MGLFSEMVKLEKELAVRDEMAQKIIAEITRIKAENKKLKDKLLGVTELVENKRLKADLLEASRHIEYLAGKLQEQGIHDG